VRGDTDEDRKVRGRRGRPATGGDTAGVVRRWGRRLDCGWQDDVIKTRPREEGHRQRQGLSVAGKEGVARSGTLDLVPPSLAD
jgi:hypothetical protein